MRAAAAVGRIGRLCALAAAAAALAGAPASVIAQRPAILDRATLDASVGVNFHALLAPDTVWVGEQAVYEVGVFMDDDVRSRLRRNPEFIPPELRSMIAYDLPTHHAYVDRPGRNGGRFEAHVFQRAVFPLAPGRYEIPPASLAYSLPLSRSFFSREESFSKRTRRVSLVVEPLPDEGRPGTFDGAVGRYTLAVAADAVPARVGDPLRLTITVSGIGNVNLLPRPRLRLDWASSVPAGETVNIVTDGARVRGSKSFAWLVTPRREGVQRVPSVRYDYFDPTDAQYSAAESEPISVRIAPGTLAQADDSAARAAPALPIRVVYRGALPEPPARHAIFWLVVLVAPVPLAAVGASRALRRRARRRLPAGDRVRRLTEDAGRTLTGVQRARHARRTLVGALAERLRVPAVPLAHSGHLARVLRRAGVATDTARETEAIVRALEHAAYGLAHADANAPDGRVEAGLAALEVRAQAAFNAVDQEASRRPLAPRALTERRRWRSAGPLILLLAVGTSGWAGAQLARPSPAELFADGVAAYTAGRHSTARDAFHTAARREPRAADAWANFAAASWMTADTAAAVAGWQRALRLEPASADVREGLARVPAASYSPHGVVPPVPPGPLQLAALAAWVLAAATAAWSLAQQGRIAWAAVGGMLAIATALGAGSVWLEHRLNPAQLAVISRGGSTRALPALGGEPGPTLAVGEVLRVVRREGVWVRIDTGEGTVGWVEAERVIQLQE